MGTQEDIIERINQRLTMDANLVEGGFSQDIIGSVSYELANIIDTELNTIADKCFVETAPTMEDLTRVASDYGIEPRTKTNAIVYLKITGTNGTIVNQNVKAVYQNLVFTVQELVQIGSTGFVTVKAMCETAGSVGNVPANTITQFLTQYAGLTAVNNPDASYDGFDDEGLEEFRTRVKLYIREDAANCNEAQYKQWALSVAGVKKAVVKGADTEGAGNVGVYISSASGTASPELISTVQDYIEEKQFINATVIVQSLTVVDIDTVATVQLKTGYTTDDVEEEYGEMLADYLDTVTNNVSYFRCTDLLFACSGVADVTALTINGGTTTITLSDTDNAVVGGITINAS